MAKERKPYDKAHGRVYKGPDGDYAKFQSSPEQKKNRAARNAARAEMVKAGKAKKGDGLDVAHSKPLSEGGTNSKSNLEMRSRAKNRGRVGKDGKHR